MLDLRDSAASYPVKYEDTSNDPTSIRSDVLKKIRKDGSRSTLKGSSFRRELF